MTDKSEMRFEQGDEITIMRGKHKGQTARVLAVDESNDAYGVQFADGSFAPINAVNVKVPDEATITASQLAHVLGAEANDLSSLVMSRLEDVSPGITAHFVLAKAAA